MSLTIVTFDAWLKTLKKCAQSQGVQLSSCDDDNRSFFYNGDTPYGAVMLIDQFGY